MEDKDIVGNISYIGNKIKSYGAYQTIWGLLGHHIITGIMIMLVLFIFLFSLKGCGQDFVQKTLDDVLKKYESQYTNEMVLKDKQINTLQEQLRKSQVLSTQYENQLSKLKGEVVDIQEPKDATEIKDRLRKTGIHVK